jgi:hypothetical protein
VDDRSPIVIVIDVRWSVAVAPSRDGAGILAGRGQRAAGDQQGGGKEGTEHLGFLSVTAALPCPEDGPDRLSLSVWHMT